MNTQTQVSRGEIANVVLSSLYSLLSQKHPLPLEDMDESTSLIGRGALLDSIGLVTLIVDLEQRLESEYGISLTLANERAMSQHNSPFRTVRSLADYICVLIAEGQPDDRP